MNERLVGFMFVIAGALIFGLYGILVKTIPVSPLTFLFSMQLAGAIFFFLVAVRKKTLRLGRENLKLVLVSTFLVLMGDLLYFLSLKRLPIANAAFIKFTFPVLILLLTHILFKERIEKIVVWAALVGLGGLGAILTQNVVIALEGLGVVFAMASAVAVAAFIIALKAALSRMPAETWFFYRYGVSSLVLAPILFLSIRPSVFFGDSKLLFSLVGFGALFAVVGSMLHAGGIKRIKPYEFGILAYLEPLSATLYGSFFLSEKLMPLTIVGGMLIIVSGVLVAKHK